MKLVYVVIPVYLLVNIFIMARVLHYMGCFGKGNIYYALRIIFVIVYSIMASSIVIVYFIPTSNLYSNIQKIANIWEGAFAYFFLYAVGSDLVRFILKKMHVLNKVHLTNKLVLVLFGILIVSLTVGTSIYGYHHARQLKKTDYSVTINKEAGKNHKLKVALVADLHLGYSIGIFQISKMVEMINRENVDIVIFAGDIFDNSYWSLENPDEIRKQFLKIKSRYGMYACWGNHDVKERLFGGFSVSAPWKAKRTDKMEKFVEKCGIKTLEDEVTLVDDSFYLIGRLDAEKSGDGTNNRKTVPELMRGLDQRKPVILIDHQPKKLKEISKTGVDMMLSGHTHDGQFFPLNIFSRIIWENCAGKQKFGDMYSIVTSGLGVYGPNMRVGTDAETVFLNVRFQ